MPRWLPLVPPAERARHAGGNSQKPSWPPTPSAAHEKPVRHGVARVPAVLRFVDAKLGTYSERTIDRTLGTLRMLERGIPVSAPLERFVRAQRPDLVFVS